VRKLDRNDRETTFEYDAFNRLVAETWLDESDTVTNEIAYDWDKASNLSQIDDFFSSYAYTYDDRDRQLTEDNAGTPNAPHSVLTYTYDDVGNVTSVTDVIDDVTGATTTYEYDALNRNTRIEQDGENFQQSSVDFTYNSIGQQSTMVRRRGASEIVSTSSYDGLNRVLQIRHTGHSSESTQFDYSYDARGRIDTATDRLGTTNYGYDDLGRVVQASRSANDPRGTETFRYDANGNRVGSSVRGANYEIDPDNRLRTNGNEDFEYDLEGNLVRVTSLVSGGYTTYSYDQRNQLVERSQYSVDNNLNERETHSYDALRRRISTSIEDSVSSFTYDAGRVRADSNGTSHTHYLWKRATNAVLGHTEGDASSAWYVRDAHSSTRGVVLDSSYVNLDYLTFGALIGPPAATRYLFGRGELFGTNQLFFGTRQYDPALGRFTSPASGTNQYTFKDNNPVSNYSIPDITTKEARGLGHTDAIVCVGPVLRDAVTVAGEFVGAVVGVLDSFGPRDLRVKFLAGAGLGADIAVLANDPNFVNFAKAAASLGSVVPGPQKIPALLARIAIGAYENSGSE
jgi:YD repeat-containing protein